MMGNDKNNDGLGGSGGLSDENIINAIAEQSRQDAAGERNIDMILDIPLEISVELGRTKMAIADLLRLGQGSVIELTKLAGEPLDVMVNGRLVARGEVVVLHDKFGVRLTDIISPRERIEQLGG